MVQRYTKPVTFEDCLKYYRVLLGYEVFNTCSVRGGTSLGIAAKLRSPLYFVGDPQDAIDTYIRCDY